ncbi:MAG: hypothetical protein N2C14_20205 [Planctomycetales bacterium]
MDMESNLLFQEFSPRAGRPKPAFYVAAAFIVLALIGVSVYNSGILAPNPNNATGAGSANEGSAGDDATDPTDRSE